jgi:hypothetical protein
LLSVTSKVDELSRVTSPAVAPALSTTTLPLVASIAPVVPDS